MGTMSGALTNAERQRRYRKRLNQRVRVVSVEISDDEVSQLIDEGYLLAEKSGDPVKLANALKLKLRE
jgi:hypothetical protein